MTIHPEAQPTSRRVAARTRCKTGIAKLDDLLGEGIRAGSSLLIAGVAGTGKTVLSSSSSTGGAKRTRKGIVFSFEETAERLRATARGLGWDLDARSSAGWSRSSSFPSPTSWSRPTCS